MLLAMKPSTRPDHHGNLPPPMDKEQIVQAILDRLTVDFETHQTTSKMTRAASNDAETKSEGKYDTRSTEENYLADGLAKKALAVAQAGKAFEDLPFEEFNPTQPINLGALVELSFGDDHAWFFLGPAAGGLEIECAGKLVTVITPGSPLGNQILGKSAGDSITAPKAKIESVR